MQRPRRQAATKALEAQRSAYQESLPGRSDSEEEEPLEEPTGDSSRGRGRGRGRGQGGARGRGGARGGHDGKPKGFRRKANESDSDDAFDPGAEASPEEEGPGSAVDEDEDEDAEGEPEEEDEQPTPVRKPAKAPRKGKPAPSVGNVHASLNLKHGALRLNRRQNTRGFDRGGFHQLPGRVEPSMTNPFYKRGSINITTFEHWSAPLNMGSPFLRPSVFPRMEDPPDSGSSPVPTANSESQDMGKILTRQVIESACEAVPWPYDGQANLVRVGKSDYSSPTDRLGKWVLELSHPPRALLADYAWVPGKTHTPVVDDAADSEPLPPAPEPQAVRIDHRVLSAHESAAMRMQALMISQESQGEAGTEDEPVNVDPLDRTIPAIDITYGACPGAIPAGDEASRVEPQTLRLATGKAAEINENSHRGMNPICFYTGGYTYDVSFCPRGLNVKGPEYFAVSVSHDPKPSTTLGARERTPAPGMIQLWSITPLPENQRAAGPSDQPIQVRLEFVLHTPQGTAGELEWRPLAPGTKDAYGPDVLGHLASVFPDGQVHVFQVPHPNAVTIEQSHGTAAGVPPSISTLPILSLDVVETQILSLNWGGHSRIATGCSNGHIGVWDVAAYLSNMRPARPIRPVSYYRAHESLVTKVRWSMHPQVRLAVQPPSEPDGQPTAVQTALWNAPPNEIYSASHNGTLNQSHVNGEVVELRLGMVGSGTPVYALAWSPVTATPLVEGNAHALVTCFVRPPTYGRTRKIGTHRSATSALDVSPYHAFAASGGFDGSVRVHNAMRNSLARTPHHRASVPLYRLAIEPSSQPQPLVPPDDPDLIMPNTGNGQSEAVTAAPEAMNVDPQPAQPVDMTPHYRLVEYLAPELLIDKSTSRYDWSPSVQVTGLAWSQSINRGYLVVSTHASGLGRVQWAGSADE